MPWWYSGSWGVRLLDPRIPLAWGAPVASDRSSRIGPICDCRMVAVQVEVGPGRGVSSSCGVVDRRRAVEHRLAIRRSSSAARRCGPRNTPCRPTRSGRRPSRRRDRCGRTSSKRSAGRDSAHSGRLQSPQSWQPYIGMLRDPLERGRPCRARRPASCPSARKSRCSRPYKPLPRVKARLCTSRESR